LPDLYGTNGGPGFSQEEVERAARYHRPLYLAFVAGVALSVGVYAALEWSAPGRWLWRGVAGLGWGGSAAAWAAVVVAVAELVRLPLAWWRGFLRERRWGFSTQTPRGWLADRAKGVLLGLVLTAAAWTSAVALARALPGWWPLAAAAALALAVLLLTLAGPLVFEPLFNRFRPLEDERLAGELRSLGGRAGVPVRDVLVADASRRTTKLNAYVSGLGRTRRVVVFDTLLEAYDEPEVKLIVAHELGHRREGHVAKGTLLAMTGAVVGVVVLWAVLGPRVASPRELPLALLLFTGLELAALAPGAALSRRWERAADLWSLELTGDAEAFGRAHAALARRNLADLAPRRLVHLLLFTHPTPPERLALAHAWRLRH
jgi:STE24 endopeptidase